jgi:hypothetical protein
MKALKLIAKRKLMRRFKLFPTFEVVGTGDNPAEEDKEEKETPTKKGKGRSLWWKSGEDPKLTDSKANNKETALVFLAQSVPGILDGDFEHTSDVEMQTADKIPDTSLPQLAEKPSRKKKVDTAVPVSESRREIPRGDDLPMSTNKCEGSQDLEAPTP